MEPDYGMSLRPRANDWEALQYQFRRQYTKLYHTQESLLQTSKTFHFDENV